MAVPSREVDAVLVGAPQHDTYTIPSMKGLKLTELMVLWVSHNLQSGVAWKVNDDIGGQGRSAVQKIMPMLFKLCTEAEIATFNEVKPQPHEDQTKWSSAISMSADNIVERFKTILQRDEFDLNIRTENQKDSRKMTVSAVETRVARIRIERGKTSQPSVASVFGANTSSLVASASSSLSSTSTGSNSVVSCVVKNGGKVTVKTKGK